MNQTFQDLLELGDFYILSQKFEAAIKVLKKAEKINKRDPKLYYSIGMAYEAMNKLDEARQAFRLVLKLDAQHKGAQEHLDRLIER